MRALTPLEKWSYAIGNIPYAVKDTAFATFVVFYYTQVLGVSGTLTGLAMFIALSWDAISDPIVGSWSDRVRSKWGRRHPLMLVGSIPTALLFLALFNPPAALVGEYMLFGWLLGISILLRTFLTIYFIPFQAMGAEMSDDYDVRTELAKARVTVAWLGGMAIGAFSFVFIFQAEGGSDGRLVAANYADYGAVSTVLALVTAIVCLWGTRTTIEQLPKAKPSQGAFTLLQPLRDLLTAWHNANFRKTIGTKLAFGTAGGIFTALNLYLGTYFWEFSPQQMAGLVLPTFLATVTAFAALGRISKHIDKPRLISAACLICAINSIWFIAARLLGFLPDNGHPIIYPLQMLQTFVFVFSLVGLQILGASLLADILDEQELKTGQRQEGVFFAASAFVLKATSGMGALLAGIVIDLAGLTPGLQPGAVSAVVLNSLGVFSLLAFTSCGLIAWLCALRVRLSRRRVREIQQQLNDGGAEATSA
jgi:GPH family glycoside/pentoside/hexuronide:cation symporter